MDTPITPCEALERASRFLSEAEALLASLGQVTAADELSELHDRIFSVIHSDA
jgi:hypothetical protein